MSTLFCPNCQARNWRLEATVTRAVTFYSDRVQIRHPQAPEGRPSDHSYDKQLADSLLRKEDKTGISITYDFDYVENESRKADLETVHKLKCASCSWEMDLEEHEEVDYIDVT